MDQQSTALLYGFWAKTSGAERDRYKCYVLSKLTCVLMSSDPPALRDFPLLPFSPTYPGVPQAVDMMSLSTIFERPKSLIMTLEFSSGL